MNLETLKQEKQQLEQQREQLIAQINQITGAISYIDKLITEEENKKEEDTVEIIEEIKDKPKTKK
jgi:cell division septum initiation protein DivIVA